jgi:hypothetical protein
VDSSVVQSVAQSLYRLGHPASCTLVLWPNANPRSNSLKNVFLMKVANIYSRQHKRTQNKHINDKPGIINNV